MQNVQTNAQVGANPAIAARANSRSRAWCFTINNYTPETVAALNSIPMNLSKDYMCFQKEVAPTTGTRHIQGYIRWGNPRFFQYVSGVIPGHVQIARGSAEQNKAYCSKEGGEDFTERGTMSVQGM